MSLWPVTEKLFTQAAPHFWFGNLPVWYRTASTGSHPGLGALQGPDSLFWKGAVPRNADSQNGNTVLFSVQGGRRQISYILFPFSFRVLVSEYDANTRARSRERTRDWRDTRRMLRHNWTLHRDIYRFPGWSRHIAGKTFLLASNMQLSLFCHLFGLIHSLLDCLTLWCTNIQHSSMKLS